mmetsp:Transcript_6490/g.21887  ORF Transcript_6490/g.21887 Transcript_6490/m.21887 type:complete len:221 (+) Transcript_6490:536-1198(+)
MRSRRRRWSRRTLPPSRAPRTWRRRLMRSRPRARTSSAATTRTSTLLGAAASSPSVSRPPLWGPLTPSCGRASSSPAPTSSLVLLWCPSGPWLPPSCRRCRRAASPRAWRTSALTPSTSGSSRGRSTRASRSCSRCSSSPSGPEAFISPLPPSLPPNHHPTLLSLPPRKRRQIARASPAKTPTYGPLCSLTPRPWPRFAPTSPAPPPPPPRPPPPARGGP